MMNRISVLIVKQALQSCVINSYQLSSLNRLAYYSSSSDTKPPPSKNPKHKTSPLITLISHENKDKIEVLTLDQAKKLAERRQLKLVSIHDIDAKTKRPVYKLMTGAEFHEEELKKREEKKLSRNEPHIKAEKLLTLTNKISEHDLKSKIDKCVKWIQKFHEVRVVITGNEGDKQKTENIIEAIEKEMIPVAGRILQKRIADGSARFSIMPTIKKQPKIEETPKSVEESLKPSEVVKQIPTADKKQKLLENEKPPVDVQVRSHHTMTF